ncbi:hypothetical protein ABN154_22970 [Klebsiella michiganensis]|uniref:hypothetical protein n=1 Tax=Klebsiella michiganensis TaxID=1134687 RepID=UPI0032DAB865
MSNAIQQINFYVNEAAPETLRDRQNYLTIVFIPWLRRGLVNTERWVKENPGDVEMQELYAAYRAGVEFFNTWEREPQHD